MSQSTNDLDPLFLKAIALLRSCHPDSTRQLKDLVDDYRKKTYGVSISKPAADNVDEKIVQVKSEKEAAIKLETNITTTTSVIKSSASPVHVKEEVVEQISYFVEETSNIGSITSNIEEIEEISLGSSFEPKPKKKMRISHDDGLSSHSDNDPNDAIPIADIIAMDFDGPSCNICHMNRRIELENILVECSECHFHYHQKCHKPPVSTKEVNDPRMLWYCSKCTIKMKSEMAALQSSSSSKVNNTESNAQQISNNPPKANPFQQSKLLRRNVSTSEPPKPANTSPSVKLDRVSITPSSREGSPVPNKISKIRSDSQSSTNAAMKRLENVKKKAAKQKKNGK